MFLEIEVEAFGPGGALDEPVESLSRMRDLLRDGHHAFPRAEPGVGLIEDPGGAREEVLAGDKLIGKVVVLRFWAHGSHYSMRRIKRECLAFGRVRDMKMDERGPRHSAASRKLASGRGEGVLLL